MDKIIDFTNDKQMLKTYSGANGSKRSIIHDGELFMLKFPSIPTKNKEISYSNNCICEYIGCHVYQSIGIPVQETILGTFTTGSGKQKIVVACKDFETNGKRFAEFAAQKNAVLDLSSNGYGTDLSDILDAMNKQNAMDQKTVLTRFWDMFVVDALIANWDRHNGNWGFLYDEKANKVELAPVFDCGSCMYAQADDAVMENILSSANELHSRIFSIPTSAIQLNGKRINYFDFMSSLKSEGCNEALKRISPKINMSDIHRMIDDIPFISDFQKRFYNKMLDERKEKILDFSLRKLRNKEKDGDITDW